MEIVIAQGTGDDVTPLAAFDAALMACGVANYNLIALSSVIPPDSTLVKKTYVTPPDEYGQRLYVVMSRHDVQTQGELAVAGIGWTQAEDGRGLFVELHGRGLYQVQMAIRHTLESMIASRPSIHYGGINSEVAIIGCQSQPVCALVLAVYKSEPW